MGSDWVEYEISELCELIVDCVNKTAPKVDYETSYKMLRTTNVRHGMVDTQNCNYVEKHVFEKWTRRSKVLKGDILLTREAPIGEVGRITVEDNLFLGQRLMQYRVNPSLLDSRFLLYSFLSPYLQHQFYMHEGTGSVVSHIRVGDCLTFKIPIPPLPEQQAIAHILGSLDDKIELNRQMNETLESMAQALFKSWFVDFDPVIDNALAAGNPIPEELLARAEQRQALLLSDSDNQAIRALFPDTFEFTEEMGWIPEGWNISTFGEESDFSNGYAFKSKELTTDSTDAFHVFKMGHIKRGGGFHYDGTKSYFPTDSAKGLEKYLLKKGDLLMAMTDMKSSMALLGHTALMPENDKFLVNQRVGRLKVKENGALNYPYVYIYSNLDSTITELRSRANSGVQVNLSTAEIKATNIIVPNKSTHKLFDETAVQLFNRIFANDELSRQLAKLRDTLLPKLLSGELRITDAAAMVEEA